MANPAVLVLSFSVPEWTFKIYTGQSKANENVITGSLFFPWKDRGTLSKFASASFLVFSVTPTRALNFPTTHSSLSQALHLPMMFPWL